MEEKSAGRFTITENSAHRDMQRFLVGGAVRDLILGRDPKDRDFVILGETPDSMIAAGFKRVGGSTPDGFPVFLHPVTGEEHALARTERMVGEGTDGRGLFDFATDPTVTLEQDLARRDLTINAMAMTDDGAVIDPFGGRMDLDTRTLRHVGPAFAEDSLRVLRVARFAAKLGFSVAPETLALCRTMAGRLASLPPERIAGEIVAAMACDHPDLFLAVLRDTGALSVVFPEVSALEGVPQPVAHHPEGDAFIHTGMVLRLAAEVSKDPIVRFMALCHDVGKALTPTDMLPKHIGHDTAGVPLVEAMGARLRLPRVFTDNGKIGCEFHMRMHRVEEMRPATLVKLFDTLRIRNEPGMDTLRRLLALSEADVRGRAGHEEDSFPAGSFVLTCADAFRSVPGSAVEHLAPERRANAIHALRVEAVKKVRG